MGNPFADFNGTVHVPNLEVKQLIEEHGFTGQIVVD